MDRDRKRHRKKVAARTQGLPASSASETTNTKGESLITRWLHTSSGAGRSNDVDVPKSLPSASKQKQEYESESYESEVGSEDEDE